MAVSNEAFYVALDAKNAEIRNLRADLDRTKGDARCALATASLSGLLR
jgi:hypothetical protein